MSFPDNEILENEEDLESDETESLPQNVPVHNDTVDYGIYMQQENETMHNINESFTEYLIII